MVECMTIYVQCFAYSCIFYCGWSFPIESQARSRRVRCTGQAQRCIYEATGGYELRRSDMHDEAAIWKNIAMDGFCTMNPAIGRLLKVACGEQISHEDAKHTLSLQASLECLLPEKAKQVSNRDKEKRSSEPAAAPIATNIMDESVKETPS